MDPLTAILACFDTSLTDSERLESWADVYDWFKCGGFVPNSIPPQVFFEFVRAMDVKIDRLGFVPNVRGES